MSPTTAAQLIHEIPRIGELLLEHTNLTQDQLDEALATQERDGGLLGEILLKKNFVTPHEMMKTVCLQMGIPFHDELRPTDIDAASVNEIPINYAKSKEIIPLSRETSPQG